MDNPNYYKILKWLKVIFFNNELLNKEIFKQPTSLFCLRLKKLIKFLSTKSYRRFAKRVTL